MGKEVRKRLSLNDLGQTGSHQAGILIPKREEILDFFPRLDKTLKNPRQQLVMREAASGQRWKFNFIYYNNKLFGGTRNEYRLTGMTEYLRQVNARMGDDVVFSRTGNGDFTLRLVRGGFDASQDDQDVIVLAGGWEIKN